ncbi:MAG: hypothetical protein ACREVO_11285 [Steroidobacteraceae bacterium]
MSDGSRVVLTPVDGAAIGNLDLEKAAIVEQGPDCLSVRLQQLAGVLGRSIAADMNAATRILLKRFMGVRRLEQRYSWHSSDDESQQVRMAVFPPNRSSANRHPLGNRYSAKAGTEVARSGSPSEASAPACKAFRKAVSAMPLRPVSRDIPVPRLTIPP